MSLHELEILPSDEALLGVPARSGATSHTSATKVLNARIVAAALIIVLQLAVLAGVLDRGAGARVQTWVIPVQVGGFLVALVLGLLR